MNRSLFSLCVSFVCSSVGIAQELSPKELLDKAIRHPGHYSQICDVQMLPSPPPIPGFRQIVQGEAFLSEEMLETLKKQRKGVAEAIVQKLKTVDLFAKPKEQPTDPSIPKDAEGNVESDGDPRGYDPQTYNIMLLRILQDLDAVEAIPALLAFEERFHAALKRVEADAKSPLPTVDGVDSASVSRADSTNDDKGEPIDYDKLTEAQMAAFEQKGRIFRTVAAQRDMLAVMVRIMRKDGYGPMIESPLEKEYGKLLKDRWQDDDEMKKFKKTEDIPEEDRENIKYDPIHGTAYMIWEAIQIPYTEEKRLAIRKLAEEFAKTKLAAKP